MRRQAQQAFHGHRGEELRRAQPCFLGLDAPRNRLQLVPQRQQLRIGMAQLALQPGQFPAQGGRGDALVQGFHCGSFGSLGG
jgi:hypothetical protein